MTRKQMNLFWPVVALVILLGLLLAVAGGARSAVGRAYDLAEMKAADPYQQALALREDVADNGRGNGRLLWVLGGVLAVIALVAVMHVGAPFLKEARLGYKAVRRSGRGRGSGRGRPGGQPGVLSTLPQAPRAPLLPANTAEDGEYEDAPAPARSVERWSGCGR